MSEAQQELHEGTCIGRFTLTRKVGSGGQGSVYLAEDPKLKRAVAIKVIDKDSICDELQTDELPNEAVMAARLQHPNIVAIHDVGHFNGQPYMVFEFVEGQTFRQIIKQHGAMPARRALVLMQKVLEAIAHAHEREVLHLDLSPSNVLLSNRDEAQIMDFGLARLTDAIPDVTTVPVGTLLYMSPEQLQEKPPTPSTDVRSLGLILYEVLIGQSAITARSIHRAADEIVNQDINLDAVRALPDMEPIANLLEIALARNPTERYRNACEMLDAFKNALLEQRKRELATNEPMQGTVEFLLRRMQRRKDFPALSQSLIEINKLTAHDSTATTSQLANVVLRDYALTNKLLKLANSAFYGVIAGEVKNISHAISLLGFEQLKIAANSLTLFAHLKDRTKSEALREKLIRSFVTGLLARHLAQRQKMDFAEEAFICGMFQNLGETLTMFYFDEEYNDIEEEKQNMQVSTSLASKIVLGITYAELGAAITRGWRFPTLIVDAIRGVDEETELAEPDNEGERLRDVSCFSHRLCEVLGDGYNHGNSNRALDALHQQFHKSINIDRELLPKLALAALNRLDQHAGILGVNPQTSTWCAAAKQCIEGKASSDELLNDDVTQRFPKIAVPA